MPLQGYFWYSYASVMVHVFAFNHSIFCALTPTRRSSFRLLYMDVHKYVVIFEAALAIGSFMSGVFLQGTLLQHIHVTSLQEKYYLNLCFNCFLLWSVSWSPSFLHSHVTSACFPFVVLIFALYRYIFLLCCANLKSRALVLCARSFCFCFFLKTDSSSANSMLSACPRLRTAG